MRIIYYSLACVKGTYCERQWIQSIRSLRRYSPRAVVMLFIYGTPDANTLTEARRWGVHVKCLGAYKDSFGGIPTAWTRAFACIPTLHKFLSLRHCPSDGVEQILYIDCDTFFFGDVDELFERYRICHWYAREEPHSRRSRLNYDPQYLDEAALEDIAYKNHLMPIPPYNTGVCLMNHGLWRHLSQLDNEFLSFAWRLLVGLSRRSPYKAPFAGLVSEDSGEYDRALIFPSSNPWIIEEVALWLTLGRLPWLTHDLLSQNDVVQGSEYSSHAGYLLAHYFYRREAQFFENFSPHLM
jgi:hypothetical protein